MTVLDQLFIIGAAIVIVLLFLTAYFLIQNVRTKRKIKQLPKKGKNKKRNKRIFQQRNRLKKDQKRQLKGFILSSMFAGLLAGGISYLSYYQSMNLSSNDSDVVVKCYYLLRDFEKEITTAKNQGDDEDKVQQNIRYLATSMASQGVKKASAINTEEGQLILNRYYNSVKQLGMNASTQTKNFYGNANVVDDFLADIKKAESYEKEAFNYYKVSQAAFEKEK
ncbi:hypothetical protein DOK67_0001207 [Enterococcus sp. DIV0212c]|uniref:hypothetical protein n=1 Tax=Enterococcus sp. DIV0212c TaxID=2230867 RepID=UPI001A9B1337|nr:hypothetical protein [Enterococcus sp. DIV0212c]